MSPGLRRDVPACTCGKSVFTQDAAASICLFIIQQGKIQTLLNIKEVRSFCKEGAHLIAAACHLGRGIHLRRFNKMNSWDYICGLTSVYSHTPMLSESHPTYGDEIILYFSFTLFVSIHETETLAGHPGVRSGFNHTEKVKSADYCCYLTILNTCL